MERVINAPNCPLGCKHHPASLGGGGKQLAFKDGYMGCPAVPTKANWHKREVWESIGEAHEAALAGENGLVTPYAAEETSPGWIFCHYRCPVHKGCEWTMGWAALAFQGTELEVYI